MCLPIAQVDRFFELWRPLLRFTNEELKVVPNLSGAAPEDIMDTNHAIKIRNALWENETLLGQFIAKNPARLSPEDLNFVESWKYSRRGEFMIYKTLKKHAIFISQDKRADVFAVKGLYSSFEEMLGPNLPVLVKTVLLPYGDDIISDGLLQSYKLTFGPGIRGELKDIYDDAKERGAIITTLLPGQQIPTSGSLASKAESTNSKVLEAFSKHQYRSGRSPKTVERDVATVNAFAKTLLIQEQAPLSLRDFGVKELRDWLKHIPESERKPIILGLKRFISFSRDTGRLDWDEVENMLEIL